jgi:hypothetical protein
MAARNARSLAGLIALLASVWLLFTAGAARAATFGPFSNTTPISIFGLEAFSLPTLSVPYPSDISVAGVTGTVTKVTVTLNGLYQPLGGNVKDLDFLLVSPSGVNLLLLSDAAPATTGPDPTNPTAVTLTFDDAAAGPVPFVAPVLSGTYQPTNYSATFMNTVPCGGGALYTEPDPDNFILNPPAPAPPYGATLSVFNGTDPNGTWSLYALCDCLGSATATLQGGWSLTITTDAPSAARMMSFSAAGSKSGVTVRWRTGSEVDALGFNIYRAKARGFLRKVNHRLIAARGGTSGATYRFLDRSARSGVAYTYRLQLVDVDGTRSWYGSARARATPRQ